MLRARRDYVAKALARRRRAAAQADEEHARHDPAPSNAPPDHPEAPIDHRVSGAPAGMEGQAGVEIPGHPQAPVPPTSTKE